MNKTKEIEINFENQEGVIVPYECFKKFDYCLKDDTYIETLNCLIEDNGKLKYVGILVKNNIIPMISSIQRLAQFNDISSIKIIYEDNTSRILPVIWEDGGLYNNNYQKSKLLNYREVSIKIKSYIAT